MLGNHYTTISLILAFNQSLFQNGDLTGLTLEKVIPPSNYFTRLSFEVLPRGHERLFKKTLYRNLEDWADLQFKKLGQVKGLSLQFATQGIDDIRASGFVGGGRMINLKINKIKEVQNYIYQANLAKSASSLRPTAPRPKEIVWDDAFMLTNFPPSSIFERLHSIDQCQENLVTALTAIKKFSSENNYDSWSKIFAKALSIAEGASPKPPDYANFMEVSDFLSNTAKSLLNASSAAWVFGGMGSWNDGLGGENYDEVSADLFRTIHESFVAVCAHSLEMSASRLT